ncbi:MAG: MoxR family ATPase [Lachnospiraceae bacterium]|nr:MoxR family ATPase [Lachnospiraceae bacterium]
MEYSQGLEIVNKLESNINKVVIGKERVVKLLITSIISGGHVLLEDMPGTGKTLMAKSFAASFAGDFSRIQFTPDLLPADITGLNIYDQSTGKFNYIKGPVITNVLLADEINRATPRTQSALLEAMGEKQVTVDGKTYELKAPFIVIATENPIETAGTFPLPEAQLDRFIMHLSMGKLTEEEELKMLNTINEQKADICIEPVCNCNDILGLMVLAENIFIHNDLKEYIVKLVQKTRNNGLIQMGVSPRGTLWLLKAVKAYAFINSREYVLPDDIKELAKYVLAHRIITYAGRDIETKRKMINDILNTIEVPSEEWRA